MRGKKPYDPYDRRTSDGRPAGYARTDKPSPPGGMSRKEWTDYRKSVGLYKPRKGNPYHLPKGPHGGEFTSGPDSAAAKETEKKHKPLQRMSSKELANMASDLGVAEHRVYKLHGGPVKKELLISHIKDRIK